MPLCAPFTMDIFKFLYLYYIHFLVIIKKITYLFNFKFIAKEYTFKNKKIDRDSQRILSKYCFWLYKYTPPIHAACHHFLTCFVHQYD